MAIPPLRLTCRVQSSLAPGSGFAVSFSSEARAGFGSTPGPGTARAVSAPLHKHSASNPEPHADLRITPSTLARKLEAGQPCAGLVSLQSLIAYSALVPR